MNHFHCISLFGTELFGFLNKGLVKKALQNKLFSITIHDLREFGIGTHKKVDDYPFSSKEGMLLRADVVYKAVTSIEDYDKKRIIYTCPKGKMLNQTLSRQIYQSNQDIIFISGYYEGIDERIFDVLPIERLSIGDYIVNNGDSAVAVILETIIRQIPGVLGNQKCIDNESHVNTLLESPQYTKPVQFKNKSVPDILRSGHHGKIKSYKEKKALKETLLKRPDLLNHYPFSKKEKTMLTEILKEMVVK